MEIVKKLNVCQQNLQALGKKHQTSAQQSQWLMEIAMQFQKLSEEALLSNYGRTDVFDRNPDLRLATAVVNRSQQMSNAIAGDGQRFFFEASEKAESQVIDISAMHIGDENAGGAVNIRTVQDHPELEDLVFAARKLPELRSGSLKLANYLKGIFKEFG